MKTETRRAIALGGPRAPSHEVVAVVPSFTRTTEAYRILRDRSGLSCECPAYAHGRLCKHIRVYEYAARQMTRCHRDHGVAQHTLCAACLLRVLVVAAKRVADVAPKRVPKHALVNQAAPPEAALPAGTPVAYRSSAGVRLTAVIRGRTVVGRATPGYVIELDEGQCLPAFRTRQVAWYSVVPA